MAPRSLASATVSFGLVSIPVRLYSATQPSAGLSFHLLHAKCGSRVRQQYVCPLEGVTVARDEMVKGYEFATGQYVTFTPDEMEALEEASSHAIEIVEFVPASEVDPLYYDTPYYLGPDRGGAKAYRLLAEAMRRSGKAALARYAARGRGYLVLVRPQGDRLVMQQLLYADEVRPFPDVELERSEVKEQEVQLALKLVEQTTDDAFHPEAYHDEVRERTLALIERKVQGQEIRRVPPEGPRAQVIDLVDALKASLAASSPGPEPERHRAGPEQERRPARRAPRPAPPRARSREVSKK